MLPEIAAEALHFLSRRNLDKAAAVSKWLDALIAQHCDLYPLRRVIHVVLNKCGDDFTLYVWGENGGEPTEHTFVNMDEAAHFAGTLLCHSNVEHLELKSVTLSLGQWTTLTDAISRGAVRRLELSSVDVTSLDAHAFLVDVVGCHGLQALIVRGSAVPIGFLADDLIRSSVAKGVIELLFYGNKSDELRGVSEDLALDFFFRDEATPEGKSLRLVLDDTGITDVFLTKFLERLLSGPLRPSGSLMFKGAPKQRVLSAYARYLMPGGTDDATYRFPPVDDDSKPYEVDVSQPSSFMSMRFQLVRDSP